MNLFLTLSRYPTQPTHNYFDEVYDVQLLQVFIQNPQNSEHISSQFQYPCATELTIKNGPDSNTPMDSAVNKVTNENLSIYCTYRIKDNNLIVKETQYGANGQCLDAAKI